jgi:carbamate kinase
VAEGQRGTYEEQRENATTMARPVCALLDAGWRVVVVHGNGPQVGNLAIQQELGSSEVPEMPLFSLGAMTEGQLGSLIAIALYRQCGRRHRIAALLSHVIVDLEDPAFDHPTKPIGPFFPKETALALARARRWDVTEDAGRGFRRVVPSPTPKTFVEIDAIRALLDSGHVVVTGGGGGIPVGRGAGVWDGVDAVIDKDYAAAELAAQLHAEALLLITSVDSVQLDFGKATQRPMTWTNADEAEAHLAAGQFPPGSMGPKVRAAISFVRRGGQLAVITSPQLAVDTLESSDAADQTLGTRIASVVSGDEALA